MSLVLAASLYLGGCAAEAQVLKRDAHGGELMLRGPLAGATVEARNRMLEHCGGRFEIVDAAQALVPAHSLSGRGRVSYRCADTTAPIGEHSATELAVRGR